MYTLFARPGWGSAIVELQLAWYALPYTVEDVENPFTSAAARARLAPLNPITQIPTLLLPDGQVMTESAAITLHLADLAPARSLVPHQTTPLAPPSSAGSSSPSPTSTQPSPTPMTPPASSPTPPPNPPSRPASTPTPNASGR